jgi:hypothetical protein
MSSINVEVTSGGVVSVNGQQGAVTLTLGVPGTGVSAIVALTQTAYDALSPKVATTLYIVTPS